MPQPDGTVVQSASPPPAGKPTSPRLGDLEPERTQSLPRSPRPALPQWQHRRAVRATHKSTQLPDGYVYKDSPSLKTYEKGTGPPRVPAPMPRRDRRLCSAGLARRWWIPAARPGISTLHLGGTRAEHADPDAGEGRPRPGGHGEPGRGGMAASRDRCAGQTARPGGVFSAWLCPAFAGATTGTPSLGLPVPIRACAPLCHL